MEKRKKVTFMWENLTNCISAQVIKFGVTSDESYGQFVPSIWYNEDGSWQLWSSSCKPILVGLIIKTNLKNHKWGAFYKIPEQYSLKLLKSPKTRQIWETGTVQMNLRGMMTKCSVISCMGSWNRKRILNTN